MIEVLKDYKIPLNIENNWAEIYSNEYIIIYPELKKNLVLPYKIIGKYKLIYFEIDEKLALKGLISIWNNLNSETSKEKVEILIKNDNNSTSENMITSITGPENKIEIRPNTLLGKIYFI